MVSSKSDWGTAVVAQAGVTSATVYERVADLAIQEFGRLDILINNMAPGRSCHSGGSRYRQWAKGLEINVSSMVLMAKHRRSRHGKE